MPKLCPPKSENKHMAQIKMASFQGKEGKRQLPTVLMINEEAVTMEDA